MFCQTDEAYDYPAQAPVTVHLLSKSSALNKIQSKSKLLSTQPKSCLVDEFFEIPTSQHEDDSVGSHGSHDTRFTFLRAQRRQLEKDVIRLQKQLQQEVELHYALENALGQAAGIFSNSPHLPIDAQELLADIAMLELAVLNLEEEMNALSVQLCHEQRERQKAEHRILKFPAYDQRERQKIESRFPMLSVQDHVESIPSLESPRSYPDLMLDSSIPPSLLGGGYNLSPNAFCSAKQSCHTIAGLQHSLSPRFCNHYCTPNDSLDSSTTFYTSPSKQMSQPQSVYSSDESGSQCSCHVQGAKAGSWQHGSLFSPEKVKSMISSLTTSFEEAAGKLRNSDLKNSWRHPNKLSQDMVNCMISIYRHLAYPVDTQSSSKKILSPTSPYGNNMSSSVSSMSESSFLSFTRSPPVDLHNKELGNESSFDPYRTPEKLPWADIGVYNASIEVSEMCVGKEQLEYAAEALRMFRSLVEQLSRVDPGIMNHEEKLAFWINVYNALMMHAYLAYGVPKNDFKFFSLMQKAAYTVGGHSFNAVVIEHLLLKGKAQWYRPQIALLLAHQKLKLREEVSMFAIDRVEPLVTFGLSFGASSSPAVRVYTAENIQEELQAAFQEYARASVGITPKGKLLIPKLLYDFGRDLVEESEMCEWICQLLPCQQSNIVRHCAKHRQRGFLNSKHFTVTPFDFRFRYLFLLGPTQCVADKAM